MRNDMTHSTRPARLVEEFLPLIQQVVDTHKVLDLACGGGRNGLFLCQYHIPVVFADNNPAALKKVLESNLFDENIAETWQVDFEQGKVNPQSGNKFDVILVFNYLHRPLMKDIRESLVSGGILLYETFTVDQASIGRPQNPDYLLKHSELKHWFEDWELIHYYEGSEAEPHRYFANLVAKKPASKGHEVL